MLLPIVNLFDECDGVLKLDDEPFLLVEVLSFSDFFSSSMDMEGVDDILARECELELPDLLRLDPFDFLLEPEESSFRLRRRLWLWLRLELDVVAL